MCLWVCALATVAAAQYAGGPGDGHDRRLAAGVTLAGAPSGTAALYRGGGGDGHDVRALTVTPSGAPLAQLFAGGRGDGHDAAAAQVTIAGVDLAAVFSGGAGDGHDVTHTQVTLTGADLAALFSGGTGDGHDLAATQVTIAGADLAALFAGGRGDGFDEASGRFSLDGATLAALFTGGSGDGHDAALTQVTLAGTDLAALFGGGAGDGHDVSFFSGFAPLPLTLIALTAAAEGPVNVLRWTTAEEVGTEFFVVERAGGGATAFAEVGEVDALGAGLAAGLTTDYAFVDERPLPGTAYYRLGVYDADGAHELTAVVAVTRELLAETAAWDYGLYPNPNAGTALSVAPTGLAHGSLSVDVTSVTGQEVHRATYDYAGDPLRLDLRRRLTAGTYAVRVHAGGATRTKLIVVR